MKFSLNKKAFGTASSVRCQMSDVRQPGFTLIELLITIGLLALVSLLAVISFDTVRKNSRDQQRKADLAKIQTALETYALRNNTFPEETNGQSANDCDSSIGFGGAACPASAGSDWSTAPASDLRALVTNYILASLPRDPLNTTKYFYFYEPDMSGEGTPSCGLASPKTCRYILQAVLENGEKVNGGRGECVYTLWGGTGVPEGISLPNDCAGNDIQPSQWSGLSCCKL